MNETGTGNAMADKILDYITRMQGVSFVELEQSIKGFGGGSYEMSLPGRNIVLWQGISQAGIEALELLRTRKLIHIVPTSLMIYLCDGAVPKLPIAKRAGPYKKLHWAPVVFNPGPDPKLKKR